MPRALIFMPVAGALLLAACGDDDAPAPQPSMDETQSPAPAGAGWSRVSSDEGVALRLEQNGELTASIACLRDPARLRAESDRFQPVMSEDRFTIGAGDEAFALAADLEAGRERGVEASGDIPGDLLDRIETGQAMAFNYGAQNLGPFPVVSEADRNGFVATCREIADQGRPMA